MKLGPLLESAKIPVPAGAAELDVRAVAYDSRRAAPGSLFVAVEGFHRDGHEFVAEVLTVGAEVAQHKESDLVLVPFQPSCGRCENCQASRYAARRKLG